MNPRNMQDRLNDVKRALAKELLTQHSLSTIRETGISNLMRWKKQGVWCSAYDEWLLIIMQGKDEELITAMTGKEEHPTQLQQSPPFPGLIDEETRKRIWNEVMAKNTYEPLAD